MRVPQRSRVRCPQSLALTLLVLGACLLSVEGRAQAPAPGNPGRPATPSPGPAVHVIAVPAGPPPSTHAGGAAPIVTAAPSPVVVPPPSGALPGTPPATGQAAPVDPETQAVDDVARTLDGIKAEAAGRASQDDLAKLRQASSTAQASAETFVDANTRDLAALNARIAALSTQKGAQRPNLTTAERRERRELIARRTKLEANLQVASRVETEASKVYSDIANRRRESFSDKVFERTASPLEEDFWTSLFASLQQDNVRVLRLAKTAAATAISAEEPRGGLFGVFGLLIALVLVLPLRRLLKRLSARWIHSTDEPGDFKRTAHAVAVVLIDTALPGCAALALGLGLSWGKLLSEHAAQLMQALVIAVFWSAAILALSRQLISPSEPEARLLTVNERLARRAKSLPALTAIVTGAGFMLSRTNNVVGASLAATIAANCTISLAYAAVASLVLVALGAGAPEDRDDKEAAAEEPEARRPARALISLILSVAIMVTVVAVFAGFTTFAALISRQIFWIAVLSAATYLMLRLVDTGVDLLFEPRGLFGRALIGILGLRVPVLRQIGVLVAAGIQVLIIIFAVALALTPFGANGEMLSFHSVNLSTGFRLGSLMISPISVGTGALILVLGLGGSHILQRWVDQRFLPVTGWDTGVRNSVSTGVGYIGVAIALLCALAAAGLGFKQIALVASALSVGIGFGLQQIVQNFVSGLILLVERPVKVGDWINLGGVEGDVRRIRVRATEIQTFDRTTLIVPNSDLITKQVQNKSLGDPYGRAQLDFSIGAAKDAPRTAKVVEAVMAAEPDVLSDPAPVVLIDSITPEGAVNYKCFAYVTSPRIAARIKSKLYIALIDALSEAKIGFVGGPTSVVLEPGPELQSMLQTLSEAGAKPAPSGS